MEIKALKESIKPPTERILGIFRTEVERDNIYLYASNKEEGPCPDFILKFRFATYMSVKFGSLK